MNELQRKRVEFLRSISDAPLFIVAKEDGSISVQRWYKGEYQEVIVDRYGEIPGLMGGGVTV